MAKYHIVPTSGEPKRCVAQSGRCLYVSDDEHYGTPEEARHAFEEFQARVSHWEWKTQVPQAEGARTLEVYDPLSEEVPLSPKSGSVPDPAAERFIKAMDRSPKNALIVLEDGTVFQRGFDHDTWHLRSSRHGLLNLVEGQVVHPAAFLGYLKSVGGRLETRPDRFYPNTAYIAGLGSKVDRRARGLAALSDAEFGDLYAKAYNNCKGDYTKAPLAEASKEVLRRGGGQGSFLDIKLGTNKATPIKGLSLEGIDEDRSR